MKADERRVVITGIGVITPLGLTGEELFENLLSGKCAIGPITAFDAAEYPSRIAGEIAELDATAGIRKDQSRYYRKNLKVMSRDIQLGIAAVNAAILDTGLPLGDAKAKEPVLPTIEHAHFGMTLGAGFIPTELDDLAATVKASTCDGELSLKKWGTDGIPLMAPLWLLKYLPNMPACHASVMWDAQGPSNTITCSDASGLLAIGEATRIISRGQSDMSLAGGTESRVNPITLVRQCLLERLSTRNDTPSEACRPFDVDHNGQVLADGSGMIVLEAIDHAEGRGANIRGEIIGFGSSMHTNGINACDTDGKAVAYAIEAALDDAGIAAGDLGGVVAHGTGVPQQDVSEARGMRDALGDYADRMPITSFKGALGNMGAGCGGVDAAMAAATLAAGRLPATVNYSESNGECPIRLVSDGPAEVVGDAILVVSHAIGGQSAAVVVKRF
ncbi:MAG: beta-ketoacyl-[acyl-carrier-protein] synthase family protein [Phycisphaerae bacterium]|nr:beta-ketoacyl-[acyl-carrier-protein] synthase family protein [Phycisphaerae bacterium]